LRRVLTGSLGERIRTTPSGYLIQLEESELDLLRFESLYDAGRTAATNHAWEEASSLLSDALALWRGEALLDVACDRLQADEGVILAERRLQAMEGRIAADLQLGRYQRVVDELLRLTATHPLHEKLHEQLMLALYGSGRQADALSAYQNLRRRLVEEVGIDPRQEIQQLYLKILKGDANLLGSSTPARTSLVDGPSGDATNSSARVAQLPPSIVDFTGREGEIDEILGVARDRSAMATCAVVISGLGGIGKTALAIRAAHQLADARGGTQVFVDLRGSSSATSRDSFEVMGHLLRDLGVNGAAVPSDPEERLGLFRSTTAERRVLLVLDDARDAAQIRPLIPAGTGSTVVVTSRYPMADLEGAHHIWLSELDSEDSLALFTRIVGPARVAAEPDATASVMASCAGHPLAIRITASRLAVRRQWQIAALANRLRLTERRLDEMAVGDLAVRSCFEVSYRSIACPTGSDFGPAELFRALGLIPGPSISVSGMAALMGRPTPEVEQAAEGLASVHLIEESAPLRYRLHDLIRSYAFERAQDESSAPTRDLMIERLLTWYLHSAISAARLVNPSRRHPSPPDAVPGAELPHLATREDALRWLLEEREHLAGCLQTAEDAGLHEIAWKLPVALWDLYYLRTLWDECVTSHEIALTAARNLGDVEAEAWVLNHLGGAYAASHQLVKAIEVLERALAIRRAQGDRHAEGTVLFNLAYALQRTGDTSRAIELLKLTLAAHEEVNFVHGVGLARISLGEIYADLGDYTEAIANFEQSLAIHRQLSNSDAEADALCGLSDVSLRHGDTATALTYAHKALALSREVGHVETEARAMQCLGFAHHALGDRMRARRYVLDAIARFESMSSPAAGELQRRAAELGLD
jgi:tetratricopeptide (TPR) repeat protein